MEILRIPFKPITLEDADIFSIEKIFKYYWKDFCHACRSRIFYQGEEDYEDYFVMYTMMKTVSIYPFKMYTWESLVRLKVTCQDLDKFREAVNFFMELTTRADAVFPMLLVLYKMQKSISKLLEEESGMIDYIYPSMKEYDYHSFDNYIINYTDEKKPNDSTTVEFFAELDKTIIEWLKKEREWDEKWQNLLNSVNYDEENSKIIAGPLCRDLAKCIIDSFNDSISNFQANHLDKICFHNGDVKHAIVYRILVSYLNSVGEVKNIFKEYPDYMLQSKLLDIRSSLIKEFKQYKLGSLWCESIDLEKRLEYVGHYFVNHREEISEGEKKFFYLLDEICVITDVLTDRVKKFWPEAEYVYDSEEESPQAEAKAEAPSRFYSVVIVHSKAQEVISMMHQFLKGKTKPKDVAMPFRAAMEAGVIRRPTYGEFVSEFGEGGIKKSMFEDCCRPDRNPFYGEAYDKMVEMFKQLIEK
jgi:hypothetical protein